MRNSLSLTLEDKKQTDGQNQNILPKIPMKSMPLWREPRSDDCHFQSLKLLRSDESIVPSKNQVLPLLERLTQLKQETEGSCYSLPIFSPLHPHAISPTASTHGNFVLSPVSLASRNQRWRPVELNNVNCDLMEK